MCVCVCFEFTRTEMYLNLQEVMAEVTKALVTTKSGATSVHCPQPEALCSSINGAQYYAAGYSVSSPRLQHLQSSIFKEWWVKEFPHPQGNSPHPSSCPQEVETWHDVLPNTTKLYSRFRHLCNRKAAGTKTTGVVNSISHRQLYRISLHSSTRVVLKVIWLLQGCLNLLY